MDIYDTGFGWISPDGDMLGCQMYGHLSSLRLWKALKLVPKAKVIFEELDEIESSCQREVDKTGSNSDGEWHLLENAQDDAEVELRTILLQEGFIRVGVNPKAGVLGFEGCPDACLRHMHIINKIVKEYNAQHASDHSRQLVHTKFSSQPFLDKMIS